MSEAVARVVRRRGALPAFLTALGILAYLVLEAFLSALVRWAWLLDESTGSSLLALWSGSGVSTLITSLPFAIGVFLAFWQVAPISPSLRLGHVVTRALLAVVVGAALSFAVSLVARLGQYLLEGDLFGALASDVLPLLASAFGLLLRLAPLVVLGAVLLWGWLERHPLDYVPRGTLDEV